jgi:hypothetical protein
MRVFKRSIEQLLWPEKRDKDLYLNAGKIFRTTAESYLRLSVGALPPFLRDVSVLAGKQEILLGPIPKGTPMNLVANIDVAAGEADSDVSRADLVAAIATLAPKLAEIKLLHLDDKHAAAALLNAVPALLKVNKCPDFEMNRGHLFGTKRSDADKSALIAFLKTL